MRTFITFDLLFAVNNRLIIVVPVLRFDLFQSRHTYAEGPGKLQVSLYSRQVALHELH